MKKFQLTQIRAQNAETQPFTAKPEKRWWADVTTVEVRANGLQIGREVRMFTPNVQLVMVQDELLIFKSLIFKRMKSNGGTRRITASFTNLMMNTLTLGDKK
jgi:hypothetical protein